MRRLALGLLAVLLAPSLVLARRCGDDVDGHPVPCDCGDVLVASRSLEDDPVLHRTCSGTALLIDVPADRSATLALAGGSLSGTGHGAGIQVVRGGADGLTVVGPGTISGFAVGVLAPVGGLARVTAVTATRNRREGFVIGGTGVALTECTAERNGRDGFALRGRGHQLDGNRALDNHRYGFLVNGHEASFGASAGSQATSNGRGGFRLRGRGHDLRGAVAHGNRGAGITARLAEGRITAPVTTGNGGVGLRAVGAHLRVRDPEAHDNHAAGIEVHGGAVCEGTTCR